MIVVTGGAGFIGSAIVRGLNKRGREDILIVDRLGQDEKWKNLVNLRYHEFIPADRFIDEISQGKYARADAKHTKIEAIIHMGAESSTTERDAEYLMKNNYAYTLALAEYCVQHAPAIRFIYASSAATYGGGEHGYGDDDDTCKKLRPLNIYGYSKQAVDLHVLARGWDKHMVGLKFFNVFGPNEYHKGDMQSVAYKAWRELSQGKEFRLFRSHHPDYADGEQKRDFVWIQDVVHVVLFFLDNVHARGIYNVGSGRAAGFNELLRAVYDALGREPRIEYTDMPEGLRERYQYFTKADISKLRQAGYTAPFTPLAEAVREYVREYLMQGEKKL